MSKKEERLSKIISILKENNGCSVKDLADSLEVSDMTIRRDLKILEEQKIIESFYGGAVYNQNINNPLNDSENYDIGFNSQVMEREKILIGKKAYDLIEEDDIVIIDVGTTTEKLTEAVDGRKNFTALIFSSNNLINLMDKQNVDIIFSGGFYHRDTGMFVADDSSSVIENTRATKLFLSAAGIHEKLGMTCANAYELDTKKKIINNSLEVILLADSSKFGQVKSAFIGNLSVVDKVITDKNISDRWLEILAKEKIETILV